MITPNHLEVLIHCYCSPAVHERAYAPAVKEAIEFFLSRQMIEAQGEYYKTTDKGEAWLDALLEVPLPVRKWIIPNQPSRESDNG